MIDNSILERLKELIIARQIASQNKCGTTIIFLMLELNINHIQIIELLNELYTQELIIIRQGINGKLIFLRS